jgi:hypothetical protein
MSCDAVRPCHALLCSSVQCGAVLLGGEGESVPTVRGGQGQLHHHHIGHGEAHRCRRRGREEGGERLRVGSQLRSGGPVAGGLIISVAALYIDSQGTYTYLVSGLYFSFLTRAKSYRACL